MLPLRMNQVVTGLIASVLAVSATIGTLTLTGALNSSQPITTTAGVSAATGTFSGAVTAGGLITGNSGFTASTGTVTAQTTQITGTGNFATVSGTAMIIGQGYQMTKFLAASTTVDANSLGNGAGTSTPVSVTGATSGMSVRVLPTGDWTSPSSSVVLSGTVTSAGTVTVWFQNTSSSAVNLTNSTYNITVTNP